MAPTKFSIILDNPEGSYFPGQNVTGKVVLVLDQEKNTQGIKLKFNGEAEVDWQESQGQGGSKGYHDTESYFRSKIVLVGDEKASDITIPAGHHEYPFTFQLPDNLPSSFEGPFGHVRYDIEAIVKRSWKFDYNARIVYTVNALVDLNLQRVYMEPREASKEKSILCLCCKEGPISMRIQLPRTGYVPGESIKFSVHSSNSSSRPVSAIVVYFVREINYRAQGRSKSVSEEMTRIRGPEVQPFQSETWQEVVHIAPIPPSDLGGCKIIEISYVLKFKLDIPSSIDLKKKMPVVVGTIPYTDFFQDLHCTMKVSSPNKTQVSSEKNEEGGLAAPFPVPIPPSLLTQYPNLPLPSFQEAANFDKESAAVTENKTSGNASTASPCPSSHNNAMERPETPMPDDVEYKFKPKYATYSNGGAWKSNLNAPDKNGLN